MLLNVLRNALVTHGHPHGFCGAIFHALCLDYVLVFNQLPAPSHWQQFVQRLDEVPRLISLDAQLAAFWQSAWENETGGSLTEAIGKMQREATEDIKAAELALKRNTPNAYHSVLQAVGCLSPQFRGSGFTTALAAAALSHLYSQDLPSVAIVKAANELESDTDTIATMAGALLGAATEREPSWPIQDRSYIEAEAQRLSRISLGELQDSFMYPDLSQWNPPAKQTASVGWCGNQLAIAGLGPLVAKGSEYRAGDAVWQWFLLPFGQSILAKRRADGEGKVASSQLPGVRPMAKSDSGLKNTPDPTSKSLLPPHSTSDRSPPRRVQALHDAPHARLDSIDAWTDAVIQNEFDDLTLGRLFNRCIDRSESIDAALAFAAIIAKAKLARRRRGRSPS
jgi:ADP-ribosylglycohydrolase